MHTPEVRRMRSHIRQVGFCELGGLADRPRMILDGHRRVPDPPLLTVCPREHFDEVLVLTGA